MLIEKQRLNEQAFKDFFSKLNWKRYPRQLSAKVKEYFYLGTYEDESVIIKVKVRPTLRMEINESFKGFDRDGQKVRKGYKGKTYSFGTTVEVLVDKKFMNKIKSVAKTPKDMGIQRFSWD